MIQAWLKSHSFKEEYVCIKYRHRKASINSYLLGAASLDILQEVERKASNNELVIVSGCIKVDIDDDMNSQDNSSLPGSAVSSFSSQHSALLAILACSHLVPGQVRLSCPLAPQHGQQLQAGQLLHVFDLTSH